MFMGRMLGPVHCRSKAAIAGHNWEDMLMRSSATGVLLALVASAILIPASAQMSEKEYDKPSTERVKEHLEEGKKTFRFDTFGDEQLIRRGASLSCITPWVFSLENHSSILAVH
jgi:hypothetical protein